MLHAPTNFRASLPYQLKRKHSIKYNPIQLAKNITNSSENSWSSYDLDNIRIVDGLDFGTIYSGFTYGHVYSQQIICHTWDHHFYFKTCIALEYDDEYNKVISWGFPDKRNKDDNKLFKLHLSDIPDELKPKLPVGYEKAITDYLREIGQAIKDDLSRHWDSLNFYKDVLLVLTCTADYLENASLIMRECVYNAGLIVNICSSKLQFGTEGIIKNNQSHKYVINFNFLNEIFKAIKDDLSRHWDSLNFYKDVLLVLTCPADSSENASSIMRECVYNAGLIVDKCSSQLQLVTEAEAATIYCMDQLQEHELETGTNFMVVDCGGNTVDLTTRKLINRNQFGEITERSRDFCGSTYIDREFIMYLSRKVGHNAMEMLRKNNYGQMQYLIQEFIKRCKLPFTGVNQDFNTYDLDLEEIAPVIKQYITDENRKHLEAEDWLIELNFNDIKSMFDPVVKNVLQLIHAQLNSSPETCSAMFLVGVRIILFPSNPTTAIELGAVMYGMHGLSSMNSNSNVIASRIIKYTYGVKVRECWTKDDPIHRKFNDGRIDKFHCLAKRGTPMNVNQEITCSYLPLYPTQTKVVFYLYYTNNFDAKYCDEPGMELLGMLTMDLPGSGLDNLSFGLAFGQMEVTATTTEIMTGSYVEKFGVGVEKLNNKLTNLLEENKRLKQQHKEFQEENRYILRKNSELKEQLQNINDYRHLENQLEESEMIEILKKELQERDEQLKKHQQQVFNFERQKNEMQQLEMMSQNLEKTLKMLEFEEVPLCGCDYKSIKPANEPFRKIKKHEKLFSSARPRTLNFTYGIKVRNQWMLSDPISRKTHNGHIIRFASLVRRGTEIISSHTVCALYQPLYHNQTVAEFNIYYTQQDDPKYCDDPDMEFLGQFSIELPILCHHELPKLLLEITFYKKSIDVAVRNLMTEKIFKTCFQFCEEDY
ncbi:7403_t:CDS:10 [Funneliformis caledonium]|uniref:7403_t:CDS:1 n=1 Tax=Funneliformis caledonium TaxID=1117310 RepID=A0A9N9B032_9GLOM|nr:7403_t:CDS:10 [Funneliformis caledonium]